LHVKGRKLLSAALDDIAASSNRTCPPFGG
jgi:hypothetical protein